MPASALPKPSWYIGTSNVTWVFVPGYIGSARIVATLNPDGQTIDPASMFAQVHQQGDTLITIDHRWFGQRGFFLRLLTDLRQRPGPIILVGLSLGGQVLNHFFRWYHQLPKHDRNLKSLHLVTISTPPSPRQLRPGSRLVVKLGRFAPRIVGRLLVRWLPGCLVPGPGRRPLRRQSVRASVWLVDSLRILAASTGFGSRKSFDGRVIAVNLNPARDRTVDVLAAQRSILASYPRVEWLELGACNHGRPELEGPLYADALSRIRGWVVPSS